MSDIKSRKLRLPSPPDGKAAFYGMEFQLYRTFNLCAPRSRLLHRSKDAIR
jgi:hypothetical protein